MKNKGMKKLLSEVWKSGVANYTRTHQSLYVSKWSWARRAGVVLGEFRDMTLGGKVINQDHGLVAIYTTPGAERVSTSL